MQPTRRWILGAAGLLVAAPSIVRASSLMAMPRAPVVVTPPGLWLEFFDRITGKVCRVPCVQRDYPKVDLRIETDLGIGPTKIIQHVDLRCRASTSIMAHEIRVGRGYEPALITYAPPEPMPIASWMDVNLGLDVVSGQQPGIRDFEIKMQRTLLRALRGGGG